MVPSRRILSCAEYLQEAASQSVRRTSCCSAPQHSTTPHHSSQYSKQMEGTQLGLLLSNDSQCSVVSQGVIVLVKSIILPTLELIERVMVQSRNVRKLRSIKEMQNAKLPVLFLHTLRSEVWIITACSCVDQYLPGWLHLQ